eukprot:TRINITY_DN72515_c0_g1_i1.p1 TRINITY_DN72515_c0_g1~~TRINITY_DN72515_c0_g1_i1.p1  ORF type:complete len:293 (-),score=72.74 TRINITY_DN72515_c0_g1_i1:246-1064(-)
MRTRAVLFVTGASSGLGRATAEFFFARGARVFGVDLRKPSGVDFPFATADVTSEHDISTALDRCQETHGTPPNVVVNCAGILIGKRVLTKSGPHSLDDFMRIQHVNVGGSFNVCRLAASRLQHIKISEDIRPPLDKIDDDDGNAQYDATGALHPGQRGVFVNTSSVAAYDGQVGQIAYSASKGAIAAMTLPLARDLSREKIRVMSIAPGIFETEMVAAMPDEVKVSLGKMIPFPSRLGRPEEYARLVWQIAENPYLNGEVIRLDGGVRMAAK